MRPDAWHVVPRSDLPENGTMAFAVGSNRYVVADIDGDVVAFVVAGPAAGAVDRAVVADGHFRCPLHGWPIDPQDGRCGAAELCRYERVSAEVSGTEIRVRIGQRR